MRPDVAHPIWMIRRSEIWWTSGYATLISVGTLLPYFFANSLSPEGFSYSWFFYNPDEPNVHLQWMREAYDGRFFFDDLFTTERVPAQFTNVFLWALGRKTALKQAAWSGYSLIAEYQIARLFSGILLLIACYLFAAQLTDDLRIRKGTFWLCAVSSGLGWVVRLLGIKSLQPGDVNENLIMPEAITFLSILLYPLFSFSMFLMVLVITTALANREHDNMRLHAVVGTGAALLANVHTYDVIPLWLILAAWSLTIRSPRFSFRLAMWMLPSVAIVAYQYHVFRTNAVFAEKALTVTPTPRSIDLLLTFGFVALLAIPGAWMALRDRMAQVSMATIWMLIGCLVIYLPFSFQRKMIEGLHIPLCFLAAMTIVEFAPQLLLVVVLATTPSNLSFMQLAFDYIVTNNSTRSHVLQPPYFLRNEEWEALDWLSHHVKGDRAILCLPFLGSYVPGRSGKRVMVGHWAETLRFAEKVGMVQRFFTRMNEDQARRLLKDHGIGFVLYGYYEQSLYPDWKPPSWLRQKFEKGTTKIYEVK